jgi:hypothetical protein
MLLPQSLPFRECCMLIESHRRPVGRWIYANITAVWRQRRTAGRCGRRAFFPSSIYDADESCQAWTACRKPCGIEEDNRKQNMQPIAILVAGDNAYY